ncbi:MAG: DUF2007 domain-containing protein [Wenzhouxiangellaceae bacterium]|nr:DUF2007 domain-containing protein [Wenzhouxiangellaceae bacterium]
MSLVTIEKIYEQALAQLVRMRLESEGIPVHLGSEGFASLFGVQSAYSAIRVQVPESEAERARAVVAELKRELDADDDSRAEADRDDNSSS